MKRLTFLCLVAASASPFLEMSPPARAQSSIVWSSPEAITSADSTLTQKGTIQSATGWGYTSANIVTLSNGTTINFLPGTINSAGNPAPSGAADTSGDGAASPANFNPSSGNLTFDKVLNGFVYDGGPHTITLFGLTTGVQYSVQLFALDDRGTENGSGAILQRIADFQAPGSASDASYFVPMAANDYVIGTFTANGQTQEIIENFFNSPYYNPNSIAWMQDMTAATLGNINALVVRQLTPNPPIPAQSAVPLPSSFCLALIGTFVLFLNRRAKTRKVKVMAGPADSRLAAVSA